MNLKSICAIFQGATRIAVFVGLHYGALAARNRIDFDELKDREVVTDQYAGVVFSANVGYRPIVISNDPSVVSSPHSICTFDGKHCQGTLILTFENPVSNLSFTAAGFDAETGAVSGVMTIHHGAGQVTKMNIISTGVASTPVRIELTELRGITQLEIDSSPDEAGLGYDNFNFNSKAEIKITTNAPADNMFKITDEPAMPKIEATVEIIGATAETIAKARILWRTEVIFKTPKFTRAVQRTFKKRFTSERIRGNETYKPEFRDVIIGGDLRITASTQMNGRILKGETEEGLMIVATNPSKEAVYAYLDTIAPDKGKTLKRIVCHESSVRQFDDAGYPLWSEDGKGGVGLGQITKPPPPLGAIWNWKANAREVKAKLNGAVVNSRGFPSRVPQKLGFQTAVAALNHQRARSGLRPLNVRVPNFTTGDLVDNYQQLELDSLRVYNGAAGRDTVIGGALREFRLTTDIVDGHRILHVENIQGNTGTAVWERVPVQDRPQGIGDPNYVENVKNCPL